jgi:hypothetical protein
VADAQTAAHTGQGSFIVALRGSIPKPEDKRLKAMFFGAAGVGKTTAAIQFPAPYLIDTERGAEVVLRHLLFNLDMSVSDAFFETPFL